MLGDIKGDAKILDCGSCRANFDGLRFLFEALVCRAWGFSVCGLEVWVSRV